MNGETTVLFWDVQHGSAAYISTPNNRHIVIDLGTGSYSGNNREFSPLKYLKDTYGVTQLDYVLVTHPHRDHIDDICNFKLLKPKSFCRPKHLDKNEILKNVQTEDLRKFNEYFSINDSYNTPISPDLDPSNPNNYGGLSIQTFGSRSCSQSNINNHSIVAVVTIGAVKIIFPGDNETPSWNDLLSQPSFVREVKDAFALLAPHHGRASGYSQDLVKLVNPNLTIVSDGRSVDSTAVSRYSANSKGWNVIKNGEKENRKCLTTNTDGVIRINIKHINGAPFVGVFI